MSTRQRLLIVLTFAFAQMASAATSYVAQAGQTPASPYTNWATAASNIQDAINVTIAGDTVLVSNGVYDAGGVTNFPSGTVLTNRVAINKAITVRSANNDPTNTIIKGAWDPATNGPAAVRCVFMTNGSSLIGFTITNGATRTTGADDIYGGGVYCQSVSATTISNCIIAGNVATNRGGGAYNGTLWNCTLSGNSVISPACQGGGAYNSTMYNCTLRNNSATAVVGTEFGGGVAWGSLTNCTLVGNTAAYGGGAIASTLFNCTVVSNRGGNGGGVQNSTLWNCTLSGNSGWTGGEGGGARASTLYNCTISGNTNYDGGGVFDSTLYNCELTGNTAYRGGGAYIGTLYNCTLTGNLGSYGGGVYYSAVINSIIYFNQASTSGSNWYGTVSFTNSCTTTAAVGWATGNITDDPLFIANGSEYGTNHVAGNYRLRNISPCNNAGINFSWMTATNDVRSKDLEGLRRIDRFSGQVDMGCYERMPSGAMFMIGQ